jgi:hypothetical protein
MQKLLSKHKTSLLANLKQEQTPCHDRLPHPCGLPKVHKPDIALRPIVSPTGSPYYALAGFIQKILSPLAVRSESFIKNSAYFIQLLKSVNLQSLGILVSFDISLFNSGPVDEALQVISNKLQNDYTLVEQFALQAEAIVEMLEVCLRTAYFQVNDKFFQQVDGMAMGSYLSPIISNIYKQHFENLTLDSALHKPSLWLYYVDDTFVV